ncbi:haloacid dehalogenase-like hydrolase [Aurantiacibacter rhizosphaerae]|uniref:HAD-IB family hydrolase n=1 Tax=Aurantiacibacter rhizosphaerae TaxID=2691582 RepID=A0A844XDH5_9SPHN|nr:HAD-IB family hydrolase [Aurantiacibacter rhizosphaerae]
MRIAIYDLDRTLTQRATFTPFLMFCARRTAPWRLLALPIWIVAMLGYRAGLYSRTALKRFGLRLMTGSASPDRLRSVGEAFASRFIANPGLMPKTMAELKQDRRAGARLVIATAAFEFYATAFAAALGFDAVIATQWDGDAIPGGNCYGASKKARVLAWLEGEGIPRDRASIRFASDSFADAPLLDWADEPIFVTSSASQARRARVRGWRVIDPLET